MFHALFWIINIIRDVSIDYSSNLVFFRSFSCRSASEMIYADDIVLRRRESVRFGSDELSSACFGMSIDHYVDESWSRFTAIFNALLMYNVIQETIIDDMIAVIDSKSFRIISYRAIYFCRVYGIIAVI